MQAIRTFAQRLVCRNDGAIAVTFALVLTALCGVVALAIDFGRVFTVSSKLTQVLDASALAGAKLLDGDNVTDQQIIDRVTSFYNAQTPIYNIPIGTVASLNVVVDRTNSAVTATATGNVQTTFARVLGITQLPITKSATVVYKMRDVELALVLDTTGSMADVPAGDTQQKIQSLKTAANTVVETLYAQAINDRGIRIAIAPFSSAVNAGDYASATIASTGGNYSGYYSSYTNSSGSGCAVERLTNTTTDDGPYGSSMLRDLATVGSSGNVCPTASIIPLTGRSQKSNIESTIATLSPGGSTAGHLGAAWGWYMLSPNWSGIFSGASAPGAYNDPNVSKNLVLMTDGLFNTSYLTGLPAGSAAATTESYQQFDALCAGMKADGINVYTIGLGLNDPVATAELRNCASSDANFFTAANGSELQAAFGSIVAKLNQLRVSK